MAQVRIEMMKERAQALKDQEERLGAMVASLQMSKAKEVKVQNETKKKHTKRTLKQIN